jgi:hypothetical protein
MKTKRVSGIAAAAFAAALLSLPAGAQAPGPQPTFPQPRGVAPAPSAAPVAPAGAFDQPDAERTREELSHLLERYPPALRGVLGLDASLLSNQTYLAPYPALLNFLNSHPEIARNPAFYVGENGPFNRPKDREARILDMWEGVLGGLAGFIAAGIVIGLLTWLIRTVINYRRWNRLAKVQTDTHAKLLDRFTTNEDLLAYLQSPAGARFLQSTPITLDAAPPSVSAPLGRILWSVQVGLVLAAFGIGLAMVSKRISADVSEPLQALGVLGIALGLGFVISAIISYMISQRLGLIEPKAAQTDSPGAAR